MMKTIFGRWPSDADDRCCAWAGLVSPTDDSAEAAARELALSSRSRRFNPALIGSVLVSGFFAIRSLLMTRSSSFGLKPDVLIEALFDIGSFDEC
jgi:hypothetical protein